MKIQIINGPNMNLIGKRETSLYGDTPFESYRKKLKKRYLHVQIDYFQSNIEGEIIDKIQEVGFSYDGIVINAGGYTHTSVSIANILGRDEYRHVSFIANACSGSIMGFGLDSYRLGIEAILEMKNEHVNDSPD